MIYSIRVYLGLSVFVLIQMGVAFPANGFMTPWMFLDIAITMLLITYASDMMSLFISSVSHTTTGAMTVMPFVLIFQLVFSGGLIPLPAWSQALSNFTISNYGIRAIAAQSGYNELPMITGWKTLEGMRDNEIGGTVTLGQLMDLMQSPAIEKRRDMEVMKSYTVGEAAEILSAAEESLHLKDRQITHPIPVREVFEILRASEDFQALQGQTLADGGETGASVTLGTILDVLLADENLQQVLDREVGAVVTMGQVLDFLKAKEIDGKDRDEVLTQPVTLGNIVDFIESNEALQGQRDRTFTIKTTVGELFELFGEENVKTLVQEKTAAASQNPDYARTEDNIVENWIVLGLFILFFAAIATLALELIDKDKR